MDIRVTVDTYIRVAVVHAESAKKVHGWVRNLSAGGIFVETPDRFELDDPVVVDALARADGTAVHLKVSGWVAYVADDGMGIQFAEAEAEMAHRIRELLTRFR